MTCRDTSHCATYERYGTEAGDGLRPDPAEFVENALAAATMRARTSGTVGDNRDDAGGSSVLKNWQRPGNNPPQPSTWKDGPAFGDDDRPEGVEKDDWVHLMAFRCVHALLYTSSCAGYSIQQQQHSCKPTSPLCSRHDVHLSLGNNERIAICARKSVLSSLQHSQCLAPHPENDQRYAYWMVDGMQRLQVRSAGTDRRVLEE